MLRHWNGSTQGRSSNESNPDVASLPRRWRPSELQGRRTGKQRKKKLPGNGPSSEKRKRGAQKEKAAPSPFTW